MTKLFILLLSLALPGLFAQQSQTTNNNQEAAIKITYDPAKDTYRSELSPEISVSGAIFTLEANGSKWEAALGKNQSTNIEQVKFLGLNPTKKHTLTVALRDMSVVDKLKPRNGHKPGEAFRYEVPPGGHEFTFAPVQCAGKKVDVWMSYGLHAPDGKIIPPLGFTKGCK